MMKRIALIMGLTSAVLFAARLKIPVKPFQSQLDDPYYRSLLQHSALTPNRVNTAARDYLMARIGVPETLRVLVLRVEFPADDDATTWGNGKMDLDGFGSPSDGLAYDPPHDRTYFEHQMEGLRNFYLANSRGRLIVEYDVYPQEPFRCYQVPHKMAYYGDSSNLDRGLTLFMRDALLAAGEDAQIDFSRYHYVHEGRTFDMVVIFHAGSTVQSSFYYGYVNDLASATITPGALEAYTGQRYVEVNGVQMSTASIVPESPRAEGVMTGLPGIHYHEFAHLLGAYDVYDVSGYTQGVGAWSLMGGGGWLGYPAGQIPSMHDAYHRYLFGWEDPIVVTSDATISLYSAEFDTLAIPDWEAGQRPTLIQVPIRYDDLGEPQEYFLIENRQTDVRAIDTVEVDVKGGVPVWVLDGEYDAFQPGAGIIIWHIDEDLVDEWGDYNYINAWTAFGKHNAVDMEEADGIQDYELLYYQSSGAYASQGSQFDPFFAEGGNTEFGPGTNPSSDGYYGETGITIKVLDPSDTVMRVQITFDGKIAGFPQMSGWLRDYNSLFALDLDDDGSNELLAIGPGKTQSVSYGEAWRLDGSSYVSTSAAYINSFFDSLVAPAALGDVDGDGSEEIVMVGHRGTVAVYDSLANEHPSKLEYIMNGRAFAGAMLVDLDGDADAEILTADEFGNVYAINQVADSLELLPGYPLDVGEEVRAGFALVDRSPARYVLLTTSGRLYSFDAAGNVTDGFPVDLGAGSRQNLLPPVVADIDGDGQREIIVLIYEYNDYRYVVISLDGQVEYRSTRLFEGPVTSPALADLDADGLPEVLFGAANGLWALDANGTAVPGYPVVFPQTYKVEVPFVHGGYIYTITFTHPFSFTSSPVVGDFDGDGEAEIAVGSPDHGVYLIKMGAKKPYTILYTRDAIGKALSLADLDEDGSLDVLAGTKVDTLNSKAHVWAGAGSEIVWGQWMHDAARTGLLETKFTAAAAPSAPLSEIYVYPNPARYNAYLHVLVGEVDALKVQLIDISGKLVSAIEPSFDANMVNDISLEGLLTGIVPGLYIVRLQAMQGDEKTVELYKLGVIR
jgi:M6 family metalloprotease-like protein